MSFPCHLRGQTYGADGRRHRIDRRFDGTGDVRNAALACLFSRSDRGRPWYGETLEVSTPLGQVVVVDVPWPES